MFFEPGDNELKFPENLRNASLQNENENVKRFFARFCLFLRSDFGHVPDDNFCHPIRCPGIQTDAKDSSRGKASRKS